MAMFTAYFDASGHPDDSTAFFVSGFVSSVRDWVKFEKEWLALLDDYNIPNPFHLTDFISGRKPYDTWFLNKSRRAEFYDRAIRIIRRRTNKDFSQGIVVADLERLHAEFEIPVNDAVGNTLASPLTYCGVGAWVQVQAWEQRAKGRGLRIDGPIELIFDRGDKHRGQFARIMRDVFDIEPILKDKKDFLPIQAADILAWEHRRAADDSIAGNRRPRDEFSEVARQFPGAAEWVFSRWDKLSSYCDEKQFPKKKPTPRTI